MGTKFISRPIKHYLAKLGLALFKGLNVLLKSFFSFLKFILKPFNLILNIFYRYFLLKVYKLFYLLNKLIKKIIPADRVKIVYLFINKYILHVIIILIVVGISFANVFTAETKAEGFGEKSILFALATGETLENKFKEETLEPNQPQVTSYLETETTSVSAPQTVLTDEKAPVEEEELAMAEDSSALVKPELASIEESKQQRNKTLEYLVLEGDTISSIAEKFNISTNTILWENNLSKFSLIKPGQKLSILPTSGISHKVAKGDTLNKLAEKYQADKQKIMDFNKFIDETDLIVGDIVIIPDGQQYYAPVTTTKLASVSQIFNPTKVSVPSGVKMAWPTTARRISQYFNWRHVGLDIDGEFGDPIWAADDGVITKVAYLKYGYGYHVIIDHGGGKSTLYAHFQKIYVTQGQKVTRGTVLGEMGSTGYSTGSHLHLEVRINGKKYNPLNYIR